jgi:hypothetical protein
MVKPTRPRWGRRVAWQAAVALLVLLGVLALRREPTPGLRTLEAAAVGVVARDSVPGPAAVASLERFVEHRSWGVVLDLWARVKSQLPAATAVFPVPGGQVAESYGWHRSSQGYRFLAGALLKGPPGGPVLAPAAGTAERSRGVLWIRVSRQVEVGWRGLVQVEVRSGSHVRVDQVVGHSPGAVLLEVVEDGYPVNPAAAGYLKGRAVSAGGH